MHKSAPGFGAGGEKHIFAVNRAMKDHGCVTALDYGCGKGKLAETLGRPQWLSEYDPGVVGKDWEPSPADLVVCTDVLEHVEPDSLTAVLDHIRSLALKAVLFVVHTGPAKKILPDGRNAHLIVQPAEWWRAVLDQRWSMRREHVSDDHYSYVGAAA